MTKQQSNPSSDHEEVPAPKRRRAERKSTAESIDRSWDSAAAAEIFASSADPTDPRHSDDVVVVFEEDAATPAPETANGELDREFWEEQKPPHY
ncbi:hypothetical protein [Corynebacterium epidermidicanis]|uniref:Uncharacterized protein n=1 Tax=Corynebacterium epidermidicanis TaxID=1050174 RepID=A0A0G3GT29_9CORY|nr:hypothetical protein [Corynebacterium epidermidicanis]AKK02678.1 hypothetical protein CEPID_04025 [Corynebacterium epidermidicanis]